jgi:hypothetical protein
MDRVVPVGLRQVVAVRRTRPWQILWLARVMVPEAVFLELAGRSLSITLGQNEDHFEQLRHRIMFRSLIRLSSKIHLPIVQCRI